MSSARKGGASVCTAPVTWRAIAPMGSSNTPERIDHQVKLRGLRIELGEIEARLLEHEHVREAVVVAVDDTSLVAYVVLGEQGRREHPAPATELKLYVGQALPAYMVPNHVQVLERMPLSPNGKLDRKALPKPDAGQAAQAYVAPDSELAQQVAQNLAKRAGNRASGGSTTTSLRWAGTRCWRRKWSCAFASNWSWMFRSTCCSAHKTWANSAVNYRACKAIYSLCRMN